MRISRKDDFMKGVVTESSRIICNKCKKIFILADDVYTDGSQIDYVLCEKCFKELE